MEKFFVLKDEEIIELLIICLLCNDKMIKEDYSQYSAAKNIKIFGFKKAIRKPCKNAFVEIVFSLFDSFILLEYIVYNPINIKKQDPAI